jgi:aminopeptidase-like protein
VRIRLQDVNCFMLSVTKILNIADLKGSINPEEVGREMYALITELYPICRSITGNGFRQTMEILRRYIPLQIHEVPSGTKVFDWEIPKEWNIRDAYVKNSKGEKVVDFQESNLHVLNYSIPVKKIVSLKELEEHLFTLPDHPDWVPYRTSYYKENWCFCLSHNQFQHLEEGNYEVFIDSTLEDGFLNYGELYLKGEKEDEILISCHACHPSLANDNLSGVSLSTILAKHLKTVSHRFSYRFLFIPGTIGAIAWLCLNETSVNRIKHGLVIAGVGDSGKITYKKSRRGDAEVDRAAIHVLKHSGQDYEIIDFYPYGYDERQYCSPGFNLPVGCLSRTPYGKYPEYHTSADNLKFVHPEFLGDSFSKLLKIVYVLEYDRVYLNLCPKCEPQLGKRGLYSSIGTNELALLWLLSFSDGNHDLIDIAEMSGLEFTTIKEAADLLLEHRLITECSQVLG